MSYLFKKLGRLEYLYSSLSKLYLLSGGLQIHTNAKLGH